MKDFVMICGLPSSGNHYLRQLLRRAGFDCYITHGIEGNVRERWRKYVDRYEDPAAIMPVRDPVCSKASCKYGRLKFHPRKDLTPLPYDREYRQNALHATMSAAVEFGVDLLPLSFEALMAHPIYVFADVLVWLGMDPDKANGRAFAALGAHPPVEPNEKYYADDHALV